MDVADRAAAIVRSAWSGDPRAARHSSWSLELPRWRGLPVDEVQRGDYADVIRYLLASGVTVPGDYRDGSASAADILTGLGIVIER